MCLLLFHHYNQSPQTQLDPCLQCNKCRLSSIQFAHFAKHLDLFSIKGSRLHTPAPIGSYCGRFIHSCRIVQFQNILHLEYNSIRYACISCTEACPDHLFRRVCIEIFPCILKFIIRMFRKIPIQCLIIMSSAIYNQISCIVCLLYTSDAADEL